MNAGSAAVRWSGLLSAALVLGAACVGAVPTEQADSGPALARAPSGPVVTSTVPTGTEQGTTLDVRVLGSGFDNGSKVTLLLDGVATGKVVTNSTRYVSGKELIANITVALDAVTDAYDVQVVTLKGKKGIGTEMFEVRTITALPTLGGSTGFATDVNDAGLVTGGSGQPFVWSEAAGITALPLLPGFSSGRGRAINNSAEIAGSVGGTPRPVRWVTAGTSWTVEALGTLGAADGAGEANGINDDGIVVGWAYDAAGIRMPFRWTSATGMTPLPLPSTTTQGGAYAINVHGTIVGYAAANGATAVAWTPEGTPVPLPSAAGYNSALATGINDLGVVIGRVYGLGSNDPWVGVRWLPDPAAPNRWLAPELLVQFGARGEFEDIDNAGRIVGWRSASAGSDALLWEPGTGARVLGGLSKTGYAYARAINNPGPGQFGMIAGQSDGSSIPDQAVVWWRF